MRALISNEILKLRTSRAPWLIILIQQVLIVAALSGMAIATLDFKSPGTGRSRTPSWPLPGGRA